MGPVDSDLEDVEDALLEGDRPLEVGGARQALGYPVFRRVFLAALVSNIGSWMQTVVLAAFVFDITGSSTDVGLMTLAQLGPSFLLSPIGGMAADRFDRRRLLLVITVEQTVVALVIAWLTHEHDPRIGALLSPSWPVASARRSTHRPSPPWSPPWSTERTCREPSRSTRPT